MNGAVAPRGTPLAAPRCVRRTALEVWHRTSAAATALAARANSSSDGYVYTDAVNVNHASGYRRL
jgi:hypothetical protein